MAKMTDARDDKMDKKANIKEGSAKDRALDKSRGVPEDDGPKVTSKSKASPKSKGGKTPEMSRTR